MRSSRSLAAVPDSRKVHFSSHVVAVPALGTCFGAERAIPEASSWNHLSQAVYYRHLPDDLEARGLGASHAPRHRRSGSGGSSNGSPGGWSGRHFSRKLGWPPLEPGQQNILFVSVVNEETMPTFRVRVAIVRDSDNEEVHSETLGDALALSPGISFAELAELGRRQNACLDALAEAEREAKAAAAAGAAEAAALEGAGRELSAEELEEGREAARALQRQACALMKCAHDAVLTGGVRGTAALFEHGVELRGPWAGGGYTVHGRAERGGCLPGVGCGGSQAWCYAPPTLDDATGAANARGGMIGWLGACFGA